MSTGLNKDDEYPRSVFANDLISFGLTTQEEWISYAKDMVLDPKNNLGRILVLLRRNKEDLVSPAIIVARGPGSGLPESYIQPHTENKNCEYEKLRVIEGSANLIKFSSDGTPVESIKMTDKLISVKPGEIHTVLFQSPVAVLYEVKKVTPGLPKLFIKNSLAEDDPGVSSELKKWHEFVESEKQ